LSNKPKNILITGGSSGIGAALATLFAAPGVRLILIGQNAERLKTIGDLCRNAGAQSSEHVIDVTDQAGMEKILNKSMPLDLVIANAGISGKEDSGFICNTRKIFSVNVGGVLNTVLPALSLMRNNGGGQVAIISSVAGYRGLASAPAYSASKAAIKCWGEALRTRYAKDRIRISVVCPGFVESNMTAKNEFYMPWIMSSHRAARIIQRGLSANRRQITFPWQMRLLGAMMYYMPGKFFDFIGGLLPRKE
jgi:short-subunit dehydrogenase